jgi:hypothetical protein
MDSKTKALSELAGLIAALSNPQCHFDLVPEDQLMLNIKLDELRKEFSLIQSSGSNTHEN